MTGPTKVLHVVNGLNAGGAEMLLLLAVRHRDRHAFEYKVAYLLPGATALVEDFAAEGIEAVCLHRDRPWGLGWMGRLRRQLRRQAVDVVHAHSPLVASGVRLVVATLPRAERPRMVVTLHNMWHSHHPVVRALDRCTSAADDQRLAVSDAVRGSLPGRSGRRAVTVIHGVDQDHVADAADRDGARRELGTGADEVLIGTVGNLRSNKGYPDLIEAARLVIAAHPRARFVAIGQGPRQAELEALRDAAGLGERFRFLGHRADAPRLVSAFDVFVLASHVEGIPVALMEALVLGVPVVVTDVGGTRELVTDGREGLVVPPGRPEVLATAIGALVDDPERRAAYAGRASERGSSLDAGRAVVVVEAHYRRSDFSPPVGRSARRGPRCGGAGAPTR